MSVEGDSLVIHDKLYGLSIAIKLVRVDVVRPHEMFVEGLVDRLISDLRSKRYIKDPIIVDSATHIVLDGMHRLEALKRLGAKLVPVAMVDYHSEHIVVRSWARLIKAGGNSELVNTALSALKARLRGRGPCRLTVYVKGAKRLTLQHDDTYDMYHALRDLEESLVRHGGSVTYELDTKAIHSPHTYSRAYDLIIIPSPPTKDDVIRIVSRGMLLPPKSTRHVIPARPINLRIPLRMLYLDEHEGNRRLLEELKSRRPRLVTSGFRDDYRTYDERVYVFD